MVRVRSPSPGQGCPTFYTAMTAHSVPSEHFRMEEYIVRQKHDDTYGASRRLSSDTGTRRQTHVRMSLLARLLHGRDETRLLDEKSVSDGKSVRTHSQPPSSRGSKRRRRRACRHNLAVVVCCCHASGKQVDCCQNIVRICENYTTPQPQHSTPELDGSDGSSGSRMRETRA
jgi:hypothetical protein